MTEETQKSINATTRNLVKKHRNMIAKYSNDYANMDELAVKHALVSANQIISICSTDWGISYWSRVRKQIKSKL